jgi:hypothetical protein
MRATDFWRGTRKEQMIVFDHVCSTIYRRCNGRKVAMRRFNQVFAEALASDIVLKELADMVMYIMKEEGDI